jgi:hypothetical protein
MEDMVLGMAFFHLMGIKVVALGTFFYLEIIFNYFFFILFIMIIMGRDVGNIFLMLIQH